MIWFLMKAFLLALAGLPVTLLGLLLVAVGLPFRKSFPETMRPFSQYPQHGHWMLVDLPSWLKPWSNPFDGALGDKRGWWANERGGKHTSYLSMWLWLAIRNPANYWSRVMTGVDVSRCKIERVKGNADVIIEEPGVSNWHVLKATRDDGKTFYRFWLVWAYPFRPDKSLNIDIGWKLKLEDSEMSPDAPIKDRIVGSVFTPGIWKTLA